MADGRCCCPLLTLGCSSPPRQMVAAEEEARLRIEAEMRCEALVSEVSQLTARPLGIGPRNSRLLPGCPTAARLHVAPPAYDGSRIVFGPAYETCL